MKNFMFNIPTQIVFGKETETQIGGLVRARGGKKVMILCGHSQKDSPLLNRITVSLDEAGISHFCQADVKPNPMLSDIERRIDTAIAEKADFILAVGGGSVIDTAKAVGVGAASPEIPFEEFVTKHLPIAKTLPVGVVLTIAAAGSETSMSCMITLDKNELHTKGAIAGPAIRPVFAVMNPEATYTLPKFQLACGVADIMMHTMDRYFTKVDGNELTDVLAEGIIRVAAENGARAMQKERDYDSLSEIMWCGSLSHNGLTNLGRPMDFSVHQLGNSFSGIYPCATHGAVMAVLWPVWARKVYQEDTARFARFARNVWNVTELDDDAAALAGIAAVQNYFVQTLALPKSLHALGVQATAADLKEIAWSITGNDTRKIGLFKPLTAQDAFEIFQCAYDAE